MSLGTSPYDTAQTALNIAIIFSNDAGSPFGMAGNVLNPSTNPAVLPSFQERWRYLQQRLISASVDTFTKDTTIYGLIPAGANNPSQLMILTYGGYYNGTFWSGPNVTAPQWSNTITYYQGQTVTFSTTYYVALPNSGTNLNQEPDLATTYWQPFNNIGPCLPGDLAKPLELWERESGTNQWMPMKQAPDSLNANNIQTRFQKWSFESDKLYLLPASQTNDIRMKYIAMAPDIGSWNSPLMVRGCSTALALLVLDQLSGARGGAMADVFKARAEEAISQIVNQMVRKMAYAQYIRKPFRTGSGRRSGV